MEVIYFNEIDPVACAVLRECYDGRVDERDIRDVRPGSLLQFSRHHFCAGAGLWEVACGLAGWPEDVPLWTASVPCQPFSVAGKGQGVSDPRHLWPHLFRLVDACRPRFLVGEQVGGKAGYDWLDGVRSDLEGIGYACWAADIPACSVNAPHRRNRIYWAAVEIAESGRGDGPVLAGERQGLSGVIQPDDGSVAHPDGRGYRGRPEDPQRSAQRRDVVERADGFWNDVEWIACADGKARRSKPGIRLLVDGMAGRAGLWRLAGNSIVPQLAAEVLAALMEVMQ